MSGITKTQAQNLSKTHLDKARQAIDNYDPIDRRAQESEQKQFWKNKAEVHAHIGLAYATLAATLKD